MYLQIESGESNFADLAKRYAEGPERNTNGIVGPVPLTQAHPVLVEKLRVSQPGVLLEPFRISDWWLVVRLERYSPATFTDEVSDRMCKEMFDEWIAEQTATSLSQLNGWSTPNPDVMTQSPPFPLLKHPAFRISVAEGATVASSRARECCASSWASSSPSRMTSQRGF